MNCLLGLLILLAPVWRIATSPDMAQEIFKVRNFSRELITNADTPDLPLSAARRFDNIRADQLGRMRGIPGNASFVTGPSTIAGDLRWFQEVVLNDTQVMIVWGLDGSSVQHFYYSDDDGTTWVEITEYEITTIASVTSALIFRATDLVQDGGAGDDDYYNRWFLLHEQTSGTNDRTDYILDYDGTTREITVKYGLDDGGTPANLVGENIVLIRFPLWSAGDIFNSTDFGNTISGSSTQRRNIVRDAANFKPSIIQRDRSIAIYTGRKQDSLSSTSSNNTRDMRNLWFGHVDTGNIFDDTDLAFTGFHAERKWLEQPFDTAILENLSVNTPVTDFLANDDYAIIVTALYDGFQESDKTIYDQDTILNKIAGSIQQVIGGGNEELTFDLSVARFTIEEGSAATLDFPARNGSRRITSFRVYIATLDAIDGGFFKPTSPFYFAKEISITDGAWSTVGGDHEISITISGSDFVAAQAHELEFNRGQLSRLWVNADFAVVVKGREIVGSILFGENPGSNFPLKPGPTFDPGELIENTSYIIASAINSALRNTPDVTPVGNILDMGTENAIYKIQAMKEVNDRLAVFGENKVILMEFAAFGKLTPVQVYQERGIKGFWSVYSDGDVMRWGNQQSIYEMNATGRLAEIGLAIRDEWQALSSNNRKTSIAAYAPEQDLFILHSQSDETFIFDTLRKTWRKYKSATSWEWLSTGIDGELLATDKTDIFELFAGTPTEALTATYEKDFEFEREVQFTEFWMNYISTTLIKVFIYDLEVGTDFPVCEPLLFFPQTVPETQKETASFVAQRIRVQIVKQSSTDQDWLINGYGGYGEPLGILTEGGKES